MAEETLKIELDLKVSVEYQPDKDWYNVKANDCWAGGRTKEAALKVLREMLIERILREY